MRARLNLSWFTEICEEFGSAFSVKLKQEQCLHKEKTPYQVIEIYETTNYGKIMVIDGFFMLSDFDNFLYHEMISHPALFTHKDPQYVVIIGGGDCGTLKEVLKHPVKRAEQIEIDEQVTRLSEQYFPKLCESNNDPRAHLHFADGIKWMQRAPKNSIDIVIVDSTDPIGPAEGLFNELFYQSCHNALKEDGILVQQSESPLIHRTLIKSMHEAMLAAGFKQMSLVHFPQPIYPSGWWSATMAQKSPAKNKLRREAIQNKTFITKYYNLEIHQAALAQPEFIKTW